MVNLFWQTILTRLHLFCCSFLNTINRAIGKSCKTSKPNRSNDYTKHCSKNKFHNRCLTCYDTNIIAKKDLLVNGCIFSNTKVVIMRIQIPSYCVYFVTIMRFNLYAQILITLPKPIRIRCCTAKFS